MTGQNYSPRDMLAFGQRAEAEGRLAYAYQIYAHLAQYYANDEAGAAARTGLARLQAYSGQNYASQTPQAGQPVGYASPGATASAHAGAQHQKSMHASQSVGQQPGYATSPNGPVGDPSSRNSVSEYDVDQTDGENFFDDELADAKLSFRTGRFAMQLSQIFGWLIFVGGFALLAFEFTAGGAKATGSATAASSWLVYVAPGAMVVAGLVLILVSQIARASFESANAARQLLVIERSRTGL